MAAQHPPRAAPRSLYAGHSDRGCFERWQVSRPEAIHRGDVKLSGCCSWLSKAEAHMYFCFVLCMCYIVYIFSFAFVFLSRGCWMQQWRKNCVGQLHMSFSRGSTHQRDPALLQNFISLKSRSFPVKTPRLDFTAFTLSYCLSPDTDSYLVQNI